MMNHRPLSETVADLASKAKAVIALGSCATDGGIPAAEGNTTGATSIPDFLAAKGIATPTIRLPGCPTHPDWLVGTLAHLLSYGMPALDDQKRPKMFFSKLVHDQCPRFADYEREKFAKTFGDDGCLFN